MLSEVVAPALLELVEECGCPVGAVYFVTVVKESMWVRYARLRKGLVETFQVVAYCLTVEVVYHPAFTARSCSLDFLLGTPYLHSVYILPVDDTVLENSFASCLTQRDLRTTERPARTTVHVHLDAQRLADVLNVLQCLHPSGRQEVDIVLVVALHAIERCNLHGSDARTGIFRQVPLQVGLVNGRSEPPPACAGLCLRVWCRPCLGVANGNART